VPSIGVVIAIIRDGRVLLTKREDFEVWCMPGGAVDDGESLAQAAVREAQEETGLDVRLTRLVGMYSQPAWHGGGHHFALFAAEPSGGAMRLAPGETVDIGFFSRAALPEPLVWWHPQPIANALDGVIGAASTIGGEWPLEPRLTRAELYAMRDRSSLSRQQFYIEYFKRSDVVANVVELDGAALPNRS
jgi:ADP-ribose pyrophosphatase YjhB (NUDIX family)